MPNKNNSEFLDNVEYKDVLQEEIQNFLEIESSKSYEEIERKNSNLFIISRGVFFILDNLFFLSISS